MDQSKPWYQSSGVWGGILAALSPLAGMVFHVSFPSSEIMAFADALALTGSGVGGALSVLGRIKANSKIG